TARTRCPPSACCRARGTWWPRPTSSSPPKTSWTCSARSPEDSRPRGLFSAAEVERDGREAHQVVPGRVPLGRVHDVAAEQVVRPEGGLGAHGDERVDEVLVAQDGVGDDPFGRDLLVGQRWVDRTGRAEREADRQLRFQEALRLAVRKANGPEGH